MRENPLTHRTKHHLDLCNWGKATIRHDRTKGEKSGSAHTDKALRFLQHSTAATKCVFSSGYLDHLNGHFFPPVPLKIFVKVSLESRIKGVSCHSLWITVVFFHVEKALWVPVEYRCCAIWWEFTTSLKHAGKFTLSKWEKKRRIPQVKIPLASIKDFQSVLLPKKIEFNFFS